jgi:ornithine decarboxylase
MNDGVYSSFNCIMFDHQTVSPFCLTVGKVLVDAPTPLDTQEQDDDSKAPGVDSLTQSPLDAPPSATQPPLSVTSSLWGPTCDSIDCVLAKVKLPAALEVGDWLGFRKMGAYTICAASSFNGFDRTKVVYTTGEELAVQLFVG